MQALKIVAVGWVMSRVGGLGWCAGGAILAARQRQ
ncbi:MAG: hypothetical protein ACI91O_000955 [Candidatus Poriferisodalaceae bacterium]|jgi:hypothetical protein